MSLDLPFILALMAVPVFLMAAAVNGYHAWRQRRTLSLAALSVLIALLSLWNAGGYVLLLTGLYQDSALPLNIIWLRPSTLITGIVFTLIPGWMIAYRESVQELADCEACQERLKATEAKLTNVEQLLEMCRTANEALKKQNGNP